MTDQNDDSKDNERRRDGWCGGSDGWWEERSLPIKILMGFGFVVLGAGFFALVILVTMALWNRLMPEIFNLPVITYWQTAGLLLLSCIFFKGFGNSHDRGSKRSDRRRRRHLKRYMNDEEDV